MISAQLTYSVHALRTLQGVVMFRKKRPVPSIIFSCAVALFLFAVSFFGNLPIVFPALELPLKIFSVIFLFLCAYVTVNYAVFPMLSYKSMAKKGFPTVVLTFGKSSFLMEAQGAGIDARSEIAYAHLNQVVDTRDVILLFVQKNMAYAIEKKLISGGTAEELSELLHTCPDLPYSTRNF